MYSYYCITLLFVGLLSSATLAANCYGAASKLAVTEFDAFPSPVPVGGTVYIRANIQPTYDMGSARVQLSVYYSDKFDVTGLKPIMDLTGLQLCNLSTSVSCPLTAGTHILQWEYRVPDILPGTYQIRYTIMEDSPQDGNPYSCIQFPITIDGPKTNSFKSWYQATLLGTALFSNQEDYTQRQIGEHLQVGPLGPLNGSISPQPFYGSIKYLSGSGDLVPNSYYDTSNFVWGLSGTMTKQTIGSKNQVSHIYEGECYIGYISNVLDHKLAGSYYDHMNPLLECTFMLNWTYIDSATAHISGYAQFTPRAVIPFGWGYPLTYGRIDQHEVVTSDVGFLMIKGEVPFCASGVCQTPPNKNGGGGGLSSDKLGLAIGIPIAALFVLLLVAAALFYVKRRRETEQEDGIFAVSRKPEYGSALVVDGIIEETMGSKTMQAMLDIRDEDNMSDEGSDYGSPRGRSRTRSRSRTISRSRSNSRSESDAGDSASRDSDSD